MEYVVRGRGLVDLSQRDDMQDAQRAFLKQRDACGTNVSCLRDAYETRIGQW